MTGPEIMPQDLPQNEWEAFFLGCCLAAIPLGWPQEKIERAAEFWWPLHWYQRHGIRYGLQEDTLTQLAARYARRFTTAELADELWEVMCACEQDRHKPWTRSHAAAKAARAHRFTERADAAAAAGIAEGLAWARRVTARAQRDASSGRGARDTSGRDRRAQR